MAGFSTFVRELRRRKVLRVTVFYAGAAIAALEAADVVVGALRLPEWVLTATVVMAVLGFPLAVVVSYLYDITADGLEASAVEGERDSVSRVTVVGAAGLGLGLTLVTLWWVLASPTANASQTDTGAVATPILPGPDESPSLVILPFSVQSAEGEEARFFADGLQDELSSELGAVPGLRVLAPNAATSYDASSDARIVGSELGVGAVLTGRVRQLAGQVQVSIQLVDTRSAEQLWAENYRRGLTVKDVFDLQRAIAVEVGSALRTTLTPAPNARAASAQTADEEAYIFYLRGNRHAATSSHSSSREDALAAVDFYERAVTRDSTFSSAWAALARTESIVFGLFDATPGRRDRALRAAQKTMALSPGTPEAVVVDGYVKFWVQQDFPAAQKVFTRAREAQPNNAELQWVQGQLFRRVAQADSMLASFRRALALNPRSALYQLEVGYGFADQDRFDEAFQQYEGVIAEAPDWLGGYFATAVTSTRAPGRQADIADVLEQAAGRVGTHTLLGIVSTLAMRTLLPYLGEPLLDSLAAMPLNTVHIDSVSYYATKAALFRDRKDSTRARAYSDSVVAILEPLAEARPTEGRFQVELAYGYAGQGRKDDAMAAIERALLLAPDSKDMQTAGPWTTDFVILHIQLGELGAAVDRLATLRGRIFIPNAHAYEAHPWIAPLRDHPRFIELMSDWDETRQRLLKRPD